jgi:hypothetical protein
VNKQKWSNICNKKTNIEPEIDELVFMATQNCLQSTADECFYWKKPYGSIEKIHISGRFFISKLSIKNGKVSLLKTDKTGNGTKTSF